MLQFWKKSGQKEGSRSSSSSPTASTPPNSPSFSNVNDLQLRSNSVESSPRLGPLASFEDEGLFDLCESESTKQRSRLSKTLDEVFDDKFALGYFTQYLESRSALPLFHCWTDIDNFKLEAQKLIDEEGTTDTQTCLSSTPTKIDHDSLSVSTDCDSYTADSYSLCDYSSSSTLLDVKVNADAKSNNDKTKVVENSNVCDKNNDTSHILNSSSASSKENSNGNLQKLTDDALRIFKTYISLEATESIRCSEEIRNEIVENICDTSKILKSTCFDNLQKFIHDLLEREYFQAFLGSDYFCKHQIDVLTSGNVVLDDILYNETALFYFMEFLEQENNRSLLEFWIAASNFQLQLNEQKEFFDPVEAQNDAVVLYDKYFSLQAHCPLGFSDKIRFAVEQSICGEDGVMLDCFHLPLKIVEQVLERNYLKPFIASQLYYKYLSELINSVHFNGSLNNSLDGNRYASSDCSSEKSFSTNSTFLAMQIIHKSNQKVNKKEKGTDMNIDTRQLYDPDSLWKRKRSHRLSFGRITALGKYETDFEPEPDKKSSSKLRNVMKKFVNIEEDSKKEEMAWQVAEMIVKDITNITLSEQKGFQS